MTGRRLLILATQNPKKGRELQQLTEGRFTVKTLADLGLNPDIVEDQETFEGNARRKVDQVVEVLSTTGAVSLDDVRAVLADDSGLIVDALGGGPGVRSARFASDHDAGEGDADNNRMLLAKLKGVPAADRSARFACALCMWLLPEADARTAFATVEGHIAADELGSGGFGYDPLFIPVAHPDRRMAELLAAEKHAISHRGQAVRDVLRWLS